jgi:hypothetical protein
MCVAKGVPTDLLVDAQRSGDRKVMAATLNLIRILSVRHIISAIVFRRSRQ